MNENVVEASEVVKCSLDSKTADKAGHKSDRRFQILHRFDEIERHFPVGIRLQGKFFCYTNFNSSEKTESEK